MDDNPKILKVENLSNNWSPPFPNFFLSFKKNCFPFFQQQTNIFWGSSFLSFIVSCFPSLFSLNEDQKPLKMKKMLGPKGCDQIFLKFQTYV